MLQEIQVRGGGGGLKMIPSIGGVRIFSGITQYEKYLFSFRCPTLAIFTLEDKQIIWTDKSSNVKAGRTNFFDEQKV